MSDQLITILFDGQPLIEVDANGKYRTVSAGVNRARIDGSRLDVDSTLLQLRLVVADQSAKLAGCNPYRDAVVGDGSADAILKRIPMDKRRGMGRRDVTTVIETIQAIAKEHTQ